MEHVTQGVPAPQVCGVVLAAGAGRRIGTPKALLAGPSGSLVHLATAALTGGGCDPVAVVTGAGAEAVAELLPEGVARLDNPDWEAGMSTSVRVALSWASTLPTHGITIMPVDTPEIGPAVVARLVTAFRGAPDPERRVIQAIYAGKPRNPVLIGAAHYEDVATSMIGDAGARVWLSSHWAAIQAVECADIGDPHDLDTQDQLDRWRRTDASASSRR